MNLSSRATRARRVIAVAASGALLLSGATTLPASADNADDPPASSDVAEDLTGPRGIAVSKGRLVVAQADGTFRQIVRRTGELRPLGRVPTGGLAPALSADRANLFVLTPMADGRGMATLYRYNFKRDRRVKLADIGAYQRRDPDPFDLEDRPRTSNPFGVAALGDGGALVADAEGNDLLRVRRNGTIETVARLRPRTVRVPRGLGEDAPPPGTRMPSEAVATSVTVGPDGWWYVGELRGFPATPRKSQIWRIRPGTTDAVCDPRRPRRGACKRFADGLTSIVGLGSDHKRRRGPGILAVELSKQGWLRAESGEPGTEVGSLYRVRRNGKKRELLGGQLSLPGGATSDRAGRVYVTDYSVGHFFGQPGSVKRAR